MPRNKRNRRDSSVIQRTHNKNPKQPNISGLRSIAAIIGIFLVALVAFGSFASKRNAEMRSSSAAVALPNYVPDFSANKPAKEYVYAGSKLLAVSEAGTPVPTDLAVWRPSTGVWYVLGGPGSQSTQYTWGVSTDQPVEGDYS